MERLMVLGLLCLLQEWLGSLIREEQLRGWLRSASWWLRLRLLLQTLWIWMQGGLW